MLTSKLNIPTISPRNTKLKDFEDSIQLACATLNQLDAIVTRDREDFISGPLPIYSPAELLNQI
jgi:predicted nucleic acid-binding protein